MLSSILAGYSFTGVVQLALAKNRNQNWMLIRASFIAFLICTVALVASVMAGVLFIVPGGESKGERPIGAIWLRGMLIGVVSFSVYYS